jgi:hypothetical protein
MQKQFSVTAYLSAPFVTGGGYMTLDGLLAARLFEELQDIEAAHAAVPIKRNAGLACASGAIYEPVSVDRIAFVAQLRAGHSLNPDLIKKNKRGTLHRDVNDTSLCNVMNAYKLITAPAITWYGEGDGDEVMRLLSGVEFIGKRRASGFGRVTRWEFADGDLDGITGYAGEPLRPVPVEMFSGDDGGPVVDAAWRLPYWSPVNRAACYVPTGAINARILQ